MLPVWSSPGRVWEGRSVDVCCGLVGVAGGLGARVGGAQGADRTCVRPGRNTGDRRSLSRGLVNPAFAMGNAIQKFSEIKVPADPKTTFNVGVVGGGTSVNSIPYETWMDVD